MCANLRYLYSAWLAIVLFIWKHFRVENRLLVCTNERVCGLVSWLNISHALDHDLNLISHHRISIEDSRRARMKEDLIAWSCSSFTFHEMLSLFN